MPDTTGSNSRGEPGGGESDPGGENDLGEEMTGFKGDVDGITALLFENATVRSSKEVFDRYVSFSVSGKENKNNI